MSTVCKEGTLNKYTNVVKGWQKRFENVDIFLILEHFFITYFYQ